ncbi:MAG TPA: Crp/Fnr family transcriptional regulator [Candidatus Acidoferrales bacterium]|nr:Crp/Fnr family transcriptional regulator [Candidatus Acidoferrales bacterium]
MGTLTGTLEIPAMAKVLEFTKSVKHSAGTVICAQGKRCSDVYLIQDGIVKLTAVSRRGRTAVLGLLGKGDFFGEECLKNQETHSTSAVALVPTSTIAIARDTMLRLLRQEKELASHFLNHLLLRNQRMQQDLVNHMFDSSEKRLARVLLLLANYQEASKGPSILGRISHDNLAEMAGTTRQRVNFFMNKFRRMGFIQYNGSIKVHSSLRKILED